jgi:rhamnosyltransferase
MSNLIKLISIVILTKDDEQYIGQLLESLLEQSYSDEVEILVIDSGSTDRTVEVARQYTCRLIEIPPEDFGHGRTRNLAVREARGELVAFVVSDALPCDEKWLYHLTEHFAGNDRLAGVYGRQVGPDAPHVNPLDALEPPYPDGFRVNDLSDIENPDLLPFEQRRLLANFDNVTSCVRRELVLQTPFPKVPYAEDMAWNWNILKQGYSTIYEPQATVYHYHRQRWSYTIKRHYLDQLILLELFDTVLLPNGYQCIKRVWTHSVARCQQLWRVPSLSPLEKFYWSVCNVEFVLSAALGHYLAGWQDGRQGGVLRQIYNRLIRTLQARLMRNPILPRPSGGPHDPSRQPGSDVHPFREPSRGLRRQ